MESQNQNHWPEKMTFDEKLQTLQISKDDFHFYTSTFIQDRSRFFIKEGEKEWEEVKSRNGKSVPLNDNAICYHLLQKYTIGTVGPKKTQQFCVTIEWIKDFRSFYEQIVAYLQTPLVFFDSETKHLFFHTHIDFSISSEKLPLVLSWELDHRGIRRCPASYRIFPDSSPFLRLPLGRGSSVVDPQTLKVACPGSEVKSAIEFIKSHLRRRKFSELFPDLKRNDSYTNH
jgi:hypothetical protein